MGTDVMGRVTTAATIENLSDQILAGRGDMDPSNVRRVEVSDALVDTGATILGLPVSLIRQLGLTPHRQRVSMTSAGSKEFTIYNPVRLTIQGRDCVVDVIELPDDCPVLIGQIPLEAMDWIVDPLARRLIGNPSHGGEWRTELFSLGQ